MRGIFIENLKVYGGKIKNSWILNNYAFWKALSREKMMWILYLNFEGNASLIIYFKILFMFFLKKLYRK